MSPLTQNQSSVSRLLIRWCRMANSSGAARLSKTSGRSFHAEYQQRAAKTGITHYALEEESEISAACLHGE
ncbi:hypothetical protein [Nitrospira sp. Nam74]